MKNYRYFGAWILRILSTLSSFFFFIKIFLHHAASTEERGHKNCETLNASENHWKIFLFLFLLFSRTLNDKNSRDCNTLSFNPKFDKMAGKNRSASLKRSLQREDVNLQDHGRFNSEKNFLTLSKAFEFRQFSRKYLCFPFRTVMWKYLEKKKKKRKINIELWKHEFHIFQLNRCTTPSSRNYSRLKYKQFFIECANSSHIVHWIFYNICFQYPPKCDIRGGRTNLLRSLISVEIAPLKLSRAFLWKFTIIQNYTDNIEGEYNYTTYKNGFKSASSSFIFLFFYYFLFFFVRLEDTRGSIKMVISTYETSVCVTRYL